MDILTLTGAFLVGTAVTVPAIYLFSWLTGSMLWATISVSILWIVVLSKIKLKKIRLETSSTLLLLFSLTFSSWMMFKTFHGDTSGQLFVGSNNVFDFGHALGIIRSFSWGSNIPMTSPFESGTPFFYHFFFYFWVAIWEYFGIPTVWAMNIPSVLSFTALLIVIYYLPQIIAKQKPFVGWIAVLLTITNSSLTFWKIIGHRDIWRLPTYPFAGPFDGSTISIFVTLNNYVNQRHLAFAVALGLFLFLLAAGSLGKRKASWNKDIILGIFTGLLVGWNMVVYLFIGAVISLLLIVHRRWKRFFTYVSISAIVGFLFMVPIVGFLSTAPKFIGLLLASRGGLMEPSWHIVDYLWQNLGFLPLAAGIGILALPKKIRIIFSPFVVGFFLICLFAAVGKRGFEQKSYSFFIIGINVLAAIGIGWLWRRVKVAAVIFMFILTVSGFVDLIPIKNEFAFPLVDADTVPLITWIRDSTPKDAVFVSYSDMIDPVVLAGRKNYFGFFGNIGWYDRSPEVAKIYAGDVMLAKARGVSYILAPKWEKTDFRYKIQLDLPVRYEDARYTVFAVE